MSLTNQFLLDNNSEFTYNIGENASNLSGGQKQRLAIARAIYDDKEILIFDETTNALDKQTELKILDNILSLNKTVFFISHNLEIQYKFDGIIDLDI